MLREHLTWARINIFVLISFGGVIMLGDNQSCSGITFLFFGLRCSSQTLLRNGKYEIAPICLKFEHLSIFFVELCIHVGIIRIVIYFANINHVKVVHEILPKNEKNAVILLGIAHFLFISVWDFVPKLIIHIWGSAFPFLLPPGVSDFQETAWAFIKTKNRVRMSFYESILLDFFLPFCAAAKNSSFGKCSKHIFPQLLLLFFIVRNMTIKCRSAWKSVQNLIRQSTDNCAIRSVQFGPAFLQYHNPNLFTSSRSGK